MTTERPSVSLTLTELDAGSWVIFELPGFTTAASGTQQNSLDALRKASDTSYFKDKDALWVKVVSNGTVLAAPGAALVVEPASRSAGKLNLLYEQSPRRRPGAFFRMRQLCRSGASVVSLGASTPLFRPRISHICVDSEPIRRSRSRRTVPHGTL